MNAVLPNGPRHAPDCMGCGPDNRDGFGIRVEFHRDSVRGTVIFDDRHGGAPGYAHGGALAAVMDDLLGQVLVVLDRPAVTASLTVDYRAPVLLGRPITLEARAMDVDGRKLHLTGTMHDGPILVAEAVGLFLEVDPAHWSGSGRDLPPGWASWGRPGRDSEAT